MIGGLTFLNMPHLTRNGTIYRQALFRPAYTPHKDNCRTASSLVQTMESRFEPDTNTVLE